jgi:DNA-binding NarL/FixJ family response regulator
MSQSDITNERRFSALIADDHQFFREWLQSELRKNFDNLSDVHEANSPSQAISIARSEQIDIAFLDIDFGNEPNVSGLEAAAEIWKLCPKAAIIIISNYKGEVYVKKLYSITPDSGAYGYITKDRVGEHLVSAVRAVLSGDCWIDPEIVRIVTRLARKDYTLTDNEYEALICIALGLSDHAAAKVLCLTEKAVQARLQLLYSKFGVPSKGENNAALYNPRCRAIWCGLQRGLINDLELRNWAAEIEKRKKETGLSLTF